MKAEHRVLLDPRGRRNSGFTHPLAGGGMSQETPGSARCCDNRRKVQRTASLR